MVVFYVWHEWRARKQRVQLTSYIMVLLLNDAARNDQSLKFMRWARKAEADDPVALASLANTAIEQNVGENARDMMSSAVARLWAVKIAPEEVLF